MVEARLQYPATFGILGASLGYHPTNIAPVAAGAADETRHGFLLGLQYLKPLRVTDRLSLTGIGTLEFMDGSYADSWFAVGEGTGRLAAFEAGAGPRDVQAAVHANYVVSPRVNLSFYYGGTLLLADAAASPYTVDKYQQTFPAADVLRLLAANGPGREDHAMTTNTGNRHLGQTVALALLALAATGAAADDAVLRERLQSELGAMVTRYELPGATAACTLPDGTTVAVAAGLADVAAGTPMTPDSRMLAASVGKTFVGAVAVALAQAGDLDLDDPVAHWLGDRPWFSRLPNAGTMTLRHLLRHEAGLADHVHDPAFQAAWRARREDGDRPFTPDELIAFVLDRPPLFPSGAGWSYSDTGYLVAGLVIEAATGAFYDDSLQRLFLEPLQLDATSPSDRPALPGLATGYLAPDNAFGLPPVTTRAPGVMAWHPGLEGTGGGLVSNSRDLAVWAWSVYGGRALPDSSLAALMRSVPASDDAGPRYGLGVAIHPTGPLGPTWGHGGWIPGYVTSLRYLPGPRRRRRLPGEHRHRPDGPRTARDARHGAAAGARRRGSRDRSRTTRAMTKEPDMDTSTTTPRDGRIPFQSLLPFLAITFGLAWGILALFIGLPDQMTALFGQLTGNHPLFFLAVYAPAVAAFIIVGTRTGASGLRRYLARATLWRCSRRWYAFLLLGLPAIFYGGAALSGTLFTDPLPITSLRALAVALLLSVIKGPVEEFGWRGFALPLLQRRLAPAWSAVILGLVWGLWHLPAFLLSGTQQSAWSFTPFLAGTVAISVIATSLFNRSHGSILLAALLHFQLMNPIWPDAQPYDTYLLLGVAVLILWFDRRAMFSRESAVTEIVPRLVGRS